jgi:aspartate racemase
MQTVKHPVPKEFSPMRYFNTEKTNQVIFMKHALLYGFVLLSIILSIFIGGANADNVASSKETINATLTKNAGGVSSNESQMKTIGIIGGVSWVSSIEYYRLMNEMVNKQLGGLHSAKILMYSIEFGNFSDEERLAEKGDWSLLNRTMIDAAQRLKRGGADFIVIASNTLNSRADDIQEKVQIPVLHIADATGEKVNKSGIKTVALLGTKYTMEQNFYRDRLEKKYGLIVITPNETEREYINSVIFDELCAGKMYNKSRERFVQIIDRLVDEDGVQGVILGCTEIPLLIKQRDVKVPVFDTMTIHAEAAVKYALSGT